MRPIEFRCWDRETEEFIYSQINYDEARFAFDDGKLKGYVIHGMTSGSLDEPPQPNVKILEDPQEFTGLLDKNGKKIWEGDIVKWISTFHGAEKDIHVSQIKWDDTNTGFYLYPWCHEIYRAEMEVIGNIHENSELL